MSKPKVLFVLTSVGKMSTTGKETGWYLPEMAHPYHVLEPHTEIVVASPAGGEAPLDPGSVEMFKQDEVSVNFLNTKQSVWKNTQKLSSFLGHAGEFAAIFVVGGHGPMFDLAVDETSHKLIREFYESSKVVSAVCHGPAALVNVKLSDGSYLIAKQPVTGFSNVEEDQVGLTSAMPFKLEDKLNEASGGNFVKADQPWAEKVVVALNGRLITGQNPASATGVGEALYKVIFGQDYKE